jgi:hypothetical protein
MGGGYFSSARISQVCDHKTIACYRERTAITSPNGKGNEQHKKAAIWQEIADVCRIFSGKYRYLQGLHFTCIYLILYSKRLILYCKCLTLGHTKNQLIFLVAASIDGAGSSVKYFGQRATNS